VYRVGYILDFFEYFWSFKIWFFLEIQKTGSKKPVRWNDALTDPLSFFISNFLTTGQMHCTTVNLRVPFGEGSNNASLFGGVAQCGKGLWSFSLFSVTVKVFLQVLYVDLNFTK
jgi:hypothetical protein